MKPFDSQALGVLNKVLGVTGQSALTRTELADETLFQTIDVAEVARRGGTLADTLGIFTGILETVHTDAETLSVVVDPFSFGAGTIAPFPDPIPTKFDLWLISAAVTQISGSGTLVAVLRLNFPAPAQAFGVNDSGVAVVAGATYAIALWDSVLAAPSATIGLQESGEPVAKINMRLPRNCNLVFASTSSLTSSFRCQLVFGLFPITLGQDVVNT